MGKTKDLTAERVREVLDYNPETGEFHWKAKTAKGTKIGSAAGVAVAKVGYRYISLNVTDHLCQRLAWLHYYGVPPNGRVSFKNGDRTDCRIANLFEMKSATSFDTKTLEGRRAYNRQHRKLHPEHYKNKWLTEKFGIGLREYERKFVEQNGLCAICRKPETATRKDKPISLAVDHNHQTGVNRDLLCAACNKMIGLANEDEGILLAAISYLKRHHEPMKESAVNIVDLRSRKVV